MARRVAVKSAIPFRMAQAVEDEVGSLNKTQWKALESLVLRRLCVDGRVMAEDFIAIWREVTGIYAHEDCCCG